jgi:hypothetical protein
LPELWADPLSEFEEDPLPELDVELSVDEGAFDGGDEATGDDALSGDEVLTGDGLLTGEEVLTGLADDEDGAGSTGVVIGCATAGVAST